MLVGQMCPNDFIYDVFGLESVSELEESENLPAYVPIEGNPRADTLTALLEQIRYERTDGPTVPTRVILTQGKQAKEVLAESLIEDSANS